MSGVSFTPDQLDAIDVAKRHLDACVVAGPGSGKTTVLVEYFRRLVGAGVDPLRILAITFTEKAAGNMRKKLAEAFQQRSRNTRQAGARLGLHGAWLLRAPAAGERRLRRRRSGVSRGRRRESWRLQQESMRGAMDAAL